MKKLFSLCLMLCLWPLVCGFTNSAGTVMYSSGAVVEVVSIKYTEEDAQKIGQTFSVLDAKMKSIADLEKFAVKSKIIEKLAASPSLNPQTAAETISVDAGVTAGNDFATLSVIVTFTDKDVWGVFQEDVAKSTTNTLEETLFLKTYTTVMPLRLSTFDNGTEKQNLYDFVVSDVKTRLKSSFVGVDTLFTGEYSYTYASSVKRLHTDADVVETAQDTNLTYYTWNFSGDEDAIITIWQVRANAVSWYVLALVLTAGFGLGLWIASRKKQSKSVPENS